jgi:hypothetical protein
MRGRELWQCGQTGRAAQQVVRSPVVLGWTRLPKRRDLRLGARAEHLRPLVRVLDAGPLLERFSINGESFRLKDRRKAGLLGAHEGRQQVARTTLARRGD